MTDIKLSQINAIKGQDNAFTIRESNTPSCVNLIFNLQFIKYVVQGDVSRKAYYSYMYFFSFFLPISEFKCYYVLT